MGDRNIAAVIVTFNRKEMLIRCLEGIFSQTRPVSAIFIIDNASTDGTPELLVERGILPPMARLAEEETLLHSLLPGERWNGERPLRVYYYRLNRNKGSAGGFRKGMQLAMEEGFQWIWTMDDDVIPQRKALETQLQFSDVSLCIHPTRLNEDGTPYPEHLHLSDAQLNSAYFELNVCCFEGCLIHREILEKAGLPDERFFIVMDDKEYGLRVSQFTNIIYVRNARFVKQIPLKKSSGRFWQKVTLPTWKMYFQARNLFLLSSRRYRSFTPFRITYQLCRMVVAAAVRGPQRHKALRNIMLGIWDGIRGKFGEATWNLQ